MNLTIYLQALFINLFLIGGIYTLLRPGMLLGPIGDFAYAWLPEAVCKPLFTCLPCMSSVWGTAFFWLSSLHDLLPWYDWPLHCLALCGMAHFAMMIDKDK